MDLLPVFNGYEPEEGLWVSPTDAHHNATLQTMIAAGIYAALDGGKVGP